jgi:hypothetical protein
VVSLVSCGVAGRPGRVRQEEECGGGRTHPRGGGPPSYLYIYPQGPLRPCIQDRYARGPENLTLWDLESPALFSPGLQASPGLPGFHNSRFLGNIGIYLP